MSGLFSSLQTTQKGKDSLLRVLKQPSAKPQAWILSIREAETRGQGLPDQPGLEKVKHPGAVARAHDPSSPKEKAGRSKVQGHQLRNYCAINKQIKTSRQNNLGSR